MDTSVHTDTIVTEDVVHTMSSDTITTTPVAEVMPSAIRLPEIVSFESTIPVVAKASPPMGISAQTPNEILSDTITRLSTMKSLKTQDREALMTRVNEINETIARERKEASNLTKQAKDIDTE